MKTKRQIHASIVRDAIVQAFGVFAFCLLVGFYVSNVLEWILLPFLIIGGFWWNNRIGKRKWHNYYFDENDKPRDPLELR